MRRFRDIRRQRYDDVRMRWMRREKYFWTMAALEACPRVKPGEVIAGPHAW
jgi:hypothetical protein